MADVQSRDAQALLGIIGANIQNGKTVTYPEAATLLGRVPPEQHARAVAQICDLLDAAACLAGVPLLALVAVREMSGDINRKAWNKQYGAKRKAIIKRSVDHRFGANDIQAISDALGDLGRRGNRNAWRHVERLYPGDLLYRRLIGAYKDDTQTDAIDDLGSDIPDRTLSETWSYARDPNVRMAVLQRASGMCEFCGKPGFVKPDGTRYLECHHVIALAADGADTLTNVIALCPDDHRQAHFGAMAEQIEREMIMKLKVLNARLDLALAIAT